VLGVQQATTPIRPAVSPTPGIADPPAMAQDPVRTIDGRNGDRGGPD
jgi:hypothetical protein